MRMGIYGYQPWQKFLENRWSPSNSMANKSHGERSKESERHIKSRKITLVVVLSIGNTKWYSATYGHDYGLNSNKDKRLVVLFPRDAEYRKQGRMHETLPCTCRSGRL